MNPITSDPLDRTRYPVDEWALVETEFDEHTQGLSETIFTAYNLVPTVLLFIVIPLMLLVIQPPPVEQKRVDLESLTREDTHPAAVESQKTSAATIENARVVTGLRASSSRRKSPA